jgi:hypothetical protein
VSDSPCTGVCRLDDGVCVGCGRTMAEIREWPDLSLTARRAVLERLRKEAASGDEGRGSD